jgi:hypothetical protein
VRGRVSSRATLCMMRVRIFFHGAIILVVGIGATVGWQYAAASGDDGLIEIYQDNGKYSLDAPPPDWPPIVLNVPADFRFGGSKKKTRDWGVNILTYYPQLTSAKAPENSGFGVGCRGDCNGRILVSVENVTHGAAREFGMADVVARSYIKNFLHIGGAQPKVLPAQHGFDSGYEVDIPAGGGVGKQSILYYLHFGPDRAHYDLFANCEVNQFARTCVLHFASWCSSTIYIQVVAIDMIHIDDFLDVKEKVDGFISSMVQQPACGA